MLARYDSRIGFSYALHSHHVYSTLKRYESGSFLIVSTWNTRDVFVDCKIFTFKSYIFDFRSTAWKMFVFGIFLLSIQTECGKMRSRKASNTDTFYAVELLNSITFCNITTWHLIFVLFCGIVAWKCLSKNTQKIKTKTKRQ